MRSGGKQSLRAVIFQVSQTNGGGGADPTRCLFTFTANVCIEVQLVRMRQEAVELKGHGVEALGSAVRGSVFISCRYFHVCGLLSFWETTQRKRSETLESAEHSPGWRPRKLIRRCIFDNWLAYLKNNPALSRCVNKLLRASGRAETPLQRKVSGLAESVLHGVEWLSRIEARCGSRMFGMPRGPHTCRGVVKANEESPRMVA